MGHLGGSVGWAPDVSSRHDLMTHGFKLCVEHCADSSEPETFGFCLHLSLPPPTLILSLSQI